VTQTIERHPLHKQARDLLVGLIVRGEFAPGERVNETRVSEAIGVSRTPLRQALAGLARDGFVETRPGLGFFVTGMSPDEAREIYQLLSELEPLALQIEGYRPDLLGLRDLNATFGAAGDIEETVERNLQWHERLVHGCPNTRLRELLHGLREQARRYEFLYFAPGATSRRASVVLHERILSALEGSDLAAAAEVLKEHWLTDLDRLATPRPGKEY
jgi:DNA-binding GntR family transcriptional regulator